MGLFEQLMEKSWEPLPDATVAARDRGWAYLPAAMVSLRLFLAVVGVLFGLLAIVYIERMEFADWRPLSDPGILWLNTAVLILSSVGMEWARGAAHRGRRSGVQAGLLVGGLTGLVGVGGGFLIVPALVLLSVPMQQAVGTSLLVIAMNCAVGLASSLGATRIVWSSVALVTAGTLPGIAAGGALNRRASQTVLRRGFAVLLVLLAAFILYRNLPAALAGVR